MIAPAALAAVAGTVAAGIVDARTGFIPNVLSAATAVSAFALALAAGHAGYALLGGLAAGGALLALFALTGGRGLGLGDVKLAAAIGLGLGPLAGLRALGAAFVLGAAYALVLLALRRAQRGDAIRFGPFLSAGTLLSAAFGALQ